MSAVNCLRCKQPVADDVEACPHCGEKVTQFQRTYATRHLDGKYQIVERLGLGGMGEIFKVVHIHLGEQRVVKIMRSNIASDNEALQRFLHEARLATMIKHRNLAMLYDFATLEDGSYYMVWEFIDGTNIQKWVAANGPMPPRVALEIAIQALEGLQALHQMGVIHRDISPENIMITLDHQEKLLSKVIDFGIAKQLSDEGGGQGLTQTGMFLGKLKYASPEQAGFLKEGEHLDARSDLYSFGIVLYEMLAGRAPFLATNPQSYILKHATETPAPIAKVAPDADVPRSLEDVVFKALEKDRNKRHKDAGEFIKELTALRDVIAPDKKYGIGNNLVTLSPTRTIAETLSTIGHTRAGATVPGGTPRRPAPGGGDATVMEPSAGGAATVVESIGGAEPTMVTKAGATAGATMVTPMDQAAPTVMERRGPATTEAAPTILERKMAPGAPVRSRTPMIAIAAVVLIAVAVGLWFMLKPKPGVEPVTPTTSTDTRPTLPGGAGQGLLLTSTPYGALEEIVNAETDAKIDLGGLDDRSIPLRLPLDPGRYRVTLSDPEGNLVPKMATVEAGRFSILHTQFEEPDIDKLVDDILRQN